MIWIAMGLFVAVCMLATFYYLIVILFQWITAKPNKENKENKENKPSFISSVLNEAKEAKEAKVSARAMHKFEVKKKLVLNIENRTITYCGKDCQLPPEDFAFYWWFCNRAAEGDVGLSIPSETEPDICYGIEFLSYYRVYLSAIQLKQNESNQFENGMKRSFFERGIFRMENALVESFGEQLAKVIQINRTGKIKRKFIFAVELDAGQIIIEED